MTNMEQDFFTCLPSKISIEILSRLPVQTILSCKCVCKSWYNLVSTDKFVELHLSKAVPGLALTVKKVTVDKLFELTDDLHIGTITKLNCTYRKFASVKGSADGLLLFRVHDFLPELRLCNPITREYIDLHDSLSQPFDALKLGSVIYGFGVSKITGQYKAVGIYPDQRERMSLIHPVSECKVYTVGTGTWRSVAPHALVTYDTGDSGKFVNGRLHWLAINLNGALCISCFDLETELFDTISPPPPLQNEDTSNVLIFAFEDSLWLCDYTTKGVRVMWSMKEYGVEKSWTKEFIIESIPGLGWIYPIKIYEDGIILMTYNSNSLFYYSTKDKTTQRICTLDGGVYTTSYSHSPSFLSLKCFLMENPVSF